MKIAFTALSLCLFVALAACRGNVYIIYTGGTIGMKQGAHGWEPKSGIRRRRKENHFTVMVIWCYAIKGQRTNLQKIHRLSRRTLTFFLVIDFSLQYDKCIRLHHTHFSLVLTLHFRVHSGSDEQHACVPRA